MLSNLSSRNTEGIQFSYEIQSLKSFLIKGFEKRKGQTLLTESNSKRQEVILIFLMCITLLLNNEFNKSGVIEFETAIVFVYVAPKVIFFRKKKSLVKIFLTQIRKENAGIRFNIYSSEADLKVIKI